MSTENELVRYKKALASTRAEHRVNLAKAKDELALLTATLARERQDTVYYQAKCATMQTELVAVQTKYIELLERRARRETYQRLTEGAIKPPQRSVRHSHSFPAPSLPAMDHSCKHSIH